jgi:hypothetical protein
MQRIFPLAMGPLLFISILCFSGCTTAPKKTVNLSKNLGYSYKETHAGYQVEFHGEDQGQMNAVYFTYVGGTLCKNEGKDYFTFEDVVESPEIRFLVKCSSHKENSMYLGPKEFSATEGIEFAE